MLRHKADIKTLVYIAITTALLVVQWAIGDVIPALLVSACLMAVAVSVIAHNHNHLGMWRSKRLNRLTDYWITLFYGFPAFAWIPTHNMNHHKENNRQDDYTRTWRYSEKNNLLTLLTYPTISGVFQQGAISRYLRKLWAKNRRRFWFYISQIVALVLYLAVALLIDWRKALLFIVIPQQVALFAVLVFNYVQHVHADEESPIDHSRNFVGWGLNAFLFNNGFHTVHHDQPGLHWSKTPEAHAKIADKLHPDLQERSFLWYLFRVYILGLVFPRLRTRSFRLERLAREGAPAGVPVTADA
jgi:fatty acid desaturase